MRQPSVVRVCLRIPYSSQCLVREWIHVRFTVPAHPAVTVPGIDSGCMFIRQSRCPSDAPVSRREYRELTLRVVMAAVMVTRHAQANYLRCSLSIGPGARVFVAEGDSFCALQACIEGVQMVASVMTQTSIFVSSTGNFNIIACPPEDRNVNFLNPDRAECF